MSRSPSTTEVVETPSDIGGRGPENHPPGGRGGGDDWHSQPQGRRGPRERLNRYRLGLGLAVISILMLFIALASAYIVRQGGGKLNATGDFVPDWKPLIIPGLVWVNTVLLLLSSITVEVARRQLFSETLLFDEWLGLGKPTRQRALPWIGVTLILGLGFLFGQYLVWQRLNAQGVYMATNPSSSFFFILTGAHALHLTGGVFALGWASMATLLSRPLVSRQIATDISAWYWHFMGILWLGILGLLYFAK